MIYMTIDIEQLSEVNFSCVIKTYSCCVSILKLPIPFLYVCVPLEQLHYILYFILSITLLLLLLLLL